MTAKRFKEIYPDIIRSNYCFTDNGEPIGDKEVCDLLNEQHERITDLIENLSVTSNREMRKDFVIERLQKENEELKKDIQDKEEIIELYQGFCGKG